jgi:23S rRNA (adenine2503-C2)-methyltransferase
MNKDLKEKTLEEIEQIVTDLGGKKYLAGYLFKFIHAQGGSDIGAISTLSKAFRATLIEQGYFISQLKVVESPSAADGSTKFLFELADGERIEAVLLPDEDRRTLCVSTQVGCPMACAFCATGRIGFRRNLTAGEIVDQVNAAEASLVARHSSFDSARERVTNLVYMGMGEPLLNYDAVLKSIRILNHPSGKNIGIRHITISTCGIAPDIVKLAEEDIRPRLAISLSAPTDALRDKLMPINCKYPIADLFKAIHTYQAKTGQRVTFEYVLIEKTNDSTTHARMLVKLLRGLSCNVNLIEHNPYEGCPFKGSGRDRIAQFASVLKEANIETTTRFRLGRNIKAACGQLQAGYRASKSEIQNE